MTNSRITLDYNNILDLLTENEIFSSEDDVRVCHEMLHQKTGQGSEYLGWMDLPNKISNEEINDIESVVHFLEEEVEFLVVIGIGGSYLGAKAVIEALSDSFYNLIPRESKTTPHIIFAGHHIDPSYYNDLIKLLDGKRFAINVISKSGTTTEPALAFRILKKALERNVGKEKLKELIFSTTDKSKGALKKLSDEEGYKTFVIDDNVGGRYSVLTPVGLLPISAAGIDIRELINGASYMMNICNNPSLKDNPAYFYAVVRNLLYQKGKKIEILVNYLPSLQYIGEWWKQLYGESEGKNGKAIFPATCNFTTDLHSMGQWIQDGERSIFETIVQVQKNKASLTIDKDIDNLDQLNFLANTDMNYVNEQAAIGTSIAHLKGGVPNMTLRVPELNAYYLGQLIYLFEKACGISGYLLKVNPFDQPGVEAYKNNMFALINKPGYEEQRKNLLKEIKSKSKIV